MEATFKSVEVFGKALTIIYLSGRTEVESVALFRQACRGPLLGKNLLFNFHKLNFVGSMSLRSFLESLHFLATNESTDVRFCGVSPDFRLVLDATPLRFRPSFSSEMQGISSFEYLAPRMVSPVVATRQADGEQLGHATPNEVATVESEYINLIDQGDEDLSAEG